MALKPMPRLVLDLQGEHVPAGKFMAAAKSFFSLLDEVAAEVSGRRNAVNWSVSVEKGSVVLGVEPFSYGPDVPVRRIISTVNAGLRELERKPHRPADFNDRALTSARDLAQVCDGRMITKTSIRLLRGKKSTKPLEFKKTEAHINAILGAPIRDYGTIEGHLRTISIQGGSHFMLYDALTNDSIYCRIEEALLDEAWRLMRGRHRIAVSGMISYRKSGHPTRIDVEEMLPIGVGILPTAQDVYGVLTSFS